jgi:hypothetical protein
MTSHTLCRHSWHDSAMKRVIHAPNIALATLWSDLLNQAGIEVSVQRYFAGGISGEIPPDQALPEIWVTDDDQLERAQALLAQLTGLPHRHWRCGSCAEIVDGPFEQCWNCGAVMP